ncbi:unnamed protein product [Callosobruchus maculatus]|uniref:Uncharacterized protein n=1 Tax=Callosobruchus maculatus TaxID=64391 RepID=A0A653DJ99_CALMS|nr:unnamed protein product [Callosobruchus maculatus]
MTHISRRTMWQRRACIEQNQPSRCVDGSASKQSERQRASAPSESPAGRTDNNTTSQTADKRDQLRAADGLLGSLLLLGCAVNRERTLVFCLLLSLWAFLFVNKEWNGAADRKVTTVINTRCSRTWQVTCWVR